MYILNKAYSNNNYMENVAKILGVELGEKFRIKYNNVIGNILYKFDKRGLLFSYGGSSNEWYKDLSNTIEGILTSEYIIVKIPQDEE